MRQFHEFTRVSDETVSVLPLHENDQGGRAGESFAAEGASKATGHFRRGPPRTDGQAVGACGEGHVDVDADLIPQDASSAAPSRRPLEQLLRGPPDVEPGQVPEKGWPSGASHGAGSTGSLPSEPGLCSECRLSSASGAEARVAGCSAVISSRPVTAVDPRGFITREAYTPSTPGEFVRRRLPGPAPVPGI